MYVLVEPGTKSLPIDNVVTATGRTVEEDVIIVYPNPSSGSFTVANLPDTFIRLEITDVRGSVVFRKEAERGQHVTTIDTGLPPGIYLLGIHYESQLITKKLIIK